MHFNLIQFLFTDPITAGVNANLPGEEPFHFYIPWIIFCSLGLLIAFYYSVEGRRRFFKSKPLIKYMLDRYLGWFTIICFIGFPLIFSRAYLNAFFFAWRIWRYGWLASLLVLAILWALYLIRKYPKERAEFLAYQNRQQYIPKSSKRKKAANTR